MRSDPSPASPRAGMDRQILSITESRSENCISSIVERALADADHGFQDVSEVEFDPDRHALAYHAGWPR